MQNLYIYVINDCSCKKASREGGRLKYSWGIEPQGSGLSQY